jgi:WYL domain
MLAVRSCRWPGIVNVRQNDGEMVLQPHPLLGMAIEQRRLIRFVYHHKERIVEPHDHGVRNGSLQLLGYQVRGSSSRPLPNWLTTKVDEISELSLLEETFRGGRPTTSGRHITWDKLFIRVKPADDRLHAGPEEKGVPSAAF